MPFSLGVPYYYLLGRRHSRQHALQRAAALLQIDLSLFARKTPVILGDKERPLKAGRTYLQEVPFRQVLLYRVKVVADLPRNPFAILYIDTSRHFEIQAQNIHPILRDNFKAGAFISKRFRALVEGIVYFAVFFPIQKRHLP